jgi:hypothetical protein
LEWVLLWAKPLATRRVKAMWLSQPAKATQRATLPGWVIDLAQRRWWQGRLQK